MAAEADQVGRGFGGLWPLRKPIRKLRAVAADGRVRVSWRKAARAPEQESGPTHRVYRKRETEFDFGRDREEYFLNVDPAGAQLVFDGTVEPEPRADYAWIDDGVRVGETYSYFVAVGRHDPVGPVPCKVRDPEVWWSHQEVMVRLARLAERLPGLVTVTTCGHTLRGREIPCVQVGAGPNVLGLVGLIHAGESGPELIIPALEALAGAWGALPEDVRIVAVPAVNIDAREDLVRGVPWYVRTNAVGVDLNRNFPADWHEVSHMYGVSSADPDSVTYRGPGVASEPETRAIVEVFTQHRPKAILSYHALASICGLPAVGPACGQGDARYVARCTELVDLLGESLYPAGDGRARWLKFGASCGSLPAWGYRLGGIPAVDLESGITEDEKRSHSDLTDRALLGAYQEKHTRALRRILAHDFMRTGG